MAGSRKKGGTKGLNSFGLGDLVLAKVKGFPAWPAKISRPEDWEHAPDPKKHFVYFFGTQEIAFVAPADIQVFSTETKNKLAARCQGKTVKYFAQAVEEICSAFDELQKKDSSSSWVDEQSDSGCEVLGGTMDGVGLDEEIETAEVGVVDETFNEDGVVDRNFEHHSPEHYETDDQDLKPSTSSHAIGSPSIVKTSKRKHKIGNGSQLMEETAVSPDSPFLNRKNSTMKEVDRSIAKHSCEGEKALTNGHKPKALEPMVKRSSSTSSFQQCESGEKLKQIKGNISGSSFNEIPPSHAKSEFRTFSRKKGKGLQHRQAGLEQNKGKTDKGTSDKEFEPRVLLVLALGNPKLSEPTKRLKCAKTKVDVNASVNKGIKKDCLSNKAGRLPDHRNSVVFVKEKMASEMQVDIIGSNDSGDEAFLPVAKRRRRAMEAMTDSANLGVDDKKEKLTSGRKNEVTSIQSEDPVPRMHRKRRAVRLFDDDDDEEPKTPVHEGAMRSMKASSSAPDKVKISEASHGGVVVAKKTTIECPVLVDNRSLKKPAPAVPEESLAYSLEKRSKKEKVHALSKTLELEIEHSPLKEVKPSFVSPGKSPGKRSNKEKVHAVSKAVESEIEHSSLKEVKPRLPSPGKSPENIFASRPMVEQQKFGRPQVKVSHEGTQRKAISASSRDANHLSDTLKFSQSQASHKSRIVSSGERLKSTPRTMSQSSHVFTVAENTMEFSFLQSERCNNENRTSGSSSSIQNLIAVAQAKRKQAQMQHLPAGSHNVSLSLTAGAQGRSPSPSSAQLLVPGSLIQGDVHGSNKQTNSISPSHRPELPGSHNALDTDDIEDRRVSSSRQPVGSLSGGTEAAVSRDAFEGMIETLSRTKESIGRATRHAIDCAKLGIASEIVDLLIHKLENESSSHRKVDLFFLIDSITQCSHSQKGIAGASYIPIVQAALPRLLGSAAPRGSGAPENRRQCLKVLRLWRDRRILPEAVLRHYMDDLRASNDDTTSIPTFRRPSRAERAVDDPIREMEDMFVDEYGSNATIHLPGLKTSHMFDDDEEEEENYMAFPSLPSKVSVETSPDDVSGAADASPSDRRHCILQDVDGELEMEDVSGHPKDETASAVHGFERESFQQGPQGTRESGNWVESPLFPEGSPPLPLDSPPPLPPLPSSPPPSPLLRPLPLSPSPPPPPLPPSLPPPPPSHPPPPPPSHPPPPPPPSHPPPPPLEPPPQIPLPSRPAALPSLPPPFVSQTPVPPQLSVPSQSSFQATPHVLYQAPLPRDFNGQYVSASQQYQHGPPYPPQQPPLNILAPQNASTQYSYVKPPFQRPQHTYSQQYSYLPTDSQRQFGAEDPWAASSSEFSSDKQSGSWMNGVRVPPSGGSYSQEGYFQTQFERQPPSSNSLGFQVPATKNPLPPPPPLPAVSGHAGSLMMPSRSDVPVLNCWRPT